MSLKKYLLPFSVFITGACVLIIEIVAVRALSPYFGNTIFTTSSIISVILLALSLGYYIGGKWADRSPSLRLFYGIILVSGLLVLAMHSLGLLFLPAASRQFSLALGPLLSSVVLYLFPSLPLGTLSPFAIKLQSLQDTKAGIGSIAGQMFFWSTLGSITGSLSAGFLLIPHFGVDRIFVTTGLVLFLLGFVPLIILGVSQRWLFSFLTTALLTVGSTTFLLRVSNNPAAVYSHDGIYERLVIVDDVHKDRPTRFFIQNRTSSGAMFLDTTDPTDLAYDYTKYLWLYELFGVAPKRTLVVGGGIYSIPKAILAELPEATVDVVEIEPSLHELAKTYFQLEDSPRLRTFTEDGRRFLHDSAGQYDVIFNDVFSSLYSQPSHMVTVEYFSLVHEKLAEDGVFIANFIGDLTPEQPSLIQSEIKTFQQAFPNNYFFATQGVSTQEAQNIIAVGVKSDRVLDVRAEEVTTHSNPLFASLAEHKIDPTVFNLDAATLLTDNYAPTDYLAAQLLSRTE